MKKILTIIFILMNFCLMAMGALNEDVEISDMKLSEVAAILSKYSGQNIITDQKAGKININTYFSAGTSIDNILRSIVNSNGLSMEHSNGMTIITTKQVVNRERTKLVGTVFDYDSGETVAAAKISIKSLRNKTILTDSSGNFIMDNLPKDVYLVKVSCEGYEPVGEIVNVTKDTNYQTFYLRQADTDYILREEEDFDNNYIAIDDNLVYTRTFNLAYIKAEDMQKIIKDLYGEKIKISIDEATNKIAIVGAKDMLININKVIRKFDKKPKQVRIESEILNVSNNLFEELGFDWAYGRAKNNAENKFEVNLLNSVTNVAGGNIFGSGLTIARQFANIGDILSLSIKMLAAKNDIVISSVPNITIESGKTGEFKASEEIVVGERKTKSKKDKDNVVEPIFKEAGLIMKVKPIITNNDEIILDINLELSDFKFKQNLVDDSINNGTVNAQGGSKLGRSINTIVRVKNGSTILIGGLQKSVRHNSESKVPILGDIPLIGLAFKNTSKKFETSDMYIKITTKIED